VSAGNETDLCLADYLEHLLDRSGVRVAACYVEAVRDGPRLIRALDRTSEAGIDVVVLPAGLSGPARHAARSHTGRMLSSAATLEDVCRQHGAITVGSVRELLEACRVLTFVPHRLPPTPHIGIVGISGGMLALMSDACERYGLAVPRLTQETEAALGTTLPPFSSPANPVDVTGAILERPELLPETIAAVRADPLVDAVLVGLDNRGYDRVSELDDLEAVAGEPKPTVEVLWQAPPSRDMALERRLGQAGILVVDEPADVGAPLSWLRRRRPAGRRLEQEGVALALAPDPGDWVEQRRLLEGLGLRVPADIVIGQPADLAEADLERLGRPVVVKPAPGSVQHKTDLGLVHVGLWTLDAARRAVRSIRQVLTVEVPLLVQAQVSGVEVLVAARSDPDWGPVLTIGGGGALAEMLGDSVSFTIPCESRDVARALASLRIGRILAGYRDGPPADQDALLSFTDRLQAFYLANGHRVREVELNPVIVGPVGGGVYGVDLLVA
jgi:acyl-CoA synthetase (NDP forming)